jgi:hypothetical protein
MMMFTLTTATGGIAPRLRGFVATPGSGFRGC